MSYGDYSGPDKPSKGLEHGSCNRQRMKLSIGASRIRAMIQHIPVTDDRVTFILSVWPELDDRIAMLLAKYSDETTVNGSELRLPASWSDDD